MQHPGSAALGVYVNFFDSFTAQHFFYLFASTPALTAGAITDEKLRGTLDDLLTARGRPAEIILGKLLARAFQVFAVALVGLPVACFFGALGDLDLRFALTLCMVSAVLVVAVAAMSILASVWCRTTRDAVVCTYLVLVAVWLVVQVAKAVGWAGPANVLSPWYVADRDDAERWARLAQFSAAWLLPALTALALACARLRPAHARQRAAPARSARRRGRPRSIPANENPIVWRERCIQGIAPLARLRAIPVWLAAPAVALACAAGLVGLLLLRLPDNVDLVDILR